jgi:hypothetical protein
VQSIYNTSDIYSGGGGRGGYYILTLDAVPTFKVNIFRILWRCTGYDFEKFLYHFQIFSFYFTARNDPMLLFDSK